VPGGVPGIPPTVCTWPIAFGRHLAISEGQAPCGWRAACDHAVLGSP
jgi:hypothetical protein